jgi:ABC-2 type transport system ATP-binding protein
MGRRLVVAVMERQRKHTTLLYKTQNQDDVQRVSDSVAILNHGQLVAQAPIAELLNGGGEITYTLAIRGAVAAARARIAAQPWVTAVVDNPTPDQSLNGAINLQVRVTDAEAAEAQLLRLALDDPQTTVVGFGRTQQNLEAIFLQIVEGGTTNGNRA